MKIMVTSEKSSLGCSPEITRDVEHIVVLQEGDEEQENLNPVWHRDLVGKSKIQG